LEIYQIKEQILKWLSQEKDWNIQVNPETDYYFCCTVKMSEAGGCNVCIERDIDRVNVISNGKFTEGDAINYKLSPKKKKEEFWIALKTNLVHVGVNVDPKPDFENLETIQVAKLIYFDALSQDKLVNTMLKVTDAMDLIQLIYRNFSEEMSRQSQMG
jgi:hypothetical protein